MIERHGNIILDHSTAQALTYSPDGKWIAVSAGNLFDDIAVIDTRTGVVVERIQAHSRHVFSLEFGPKGDFLVSDSDDALVEIWSFDAQPPYLDQDAK